MLRISWLNAKLISRLQQCLLITLSIHNPVINLKFDKAVNGKKLADVVEAGMRSLNGFEVEKQSDHRYDSNGTPMEYSRFLKARKKFKFLDPFFIAFQDIEFNPFGGFGFLIPFYGQVAYNVLLTDKEDGRCVLKTRLDIDEGYTNLDLAVGGRHFRDLNYESPDYKYMKDDVESLVLYINQQLKM